MSSDQHTWCQYDVVLILILQAVNAVRIEAQMQLSRALIEERAQKDIAVQQALAQARAEMSDKHTTVTAEPITVITDAGDKVGNAILLHAIY